jgi:hypothetical protein
VLSYRSLYSIHNYYNSADVFKTSRDGTVVVYNNPEELNIASRAVKPRYELQTQLVDNVQSYCCLLSDGTKVLCVPSSSLQECIQKTMWFRQVQSVNQTQLQRVLQQYATPMMHTFTVHIYANVEATIKQIDTKQVQSRVSKLDEAKWNTYIHQPVHVASIGSNKWFALLQI